MVVEKPNYEARVGLWVLIAGVMFIYGWGWLKGLSLFHPPQRFTVQFHDVAGLNNNAPVNVNGVRVGVVDKLALKKKGEVLVNLKINSEELVIPQGSRFTIQTLGLVGAKYMEITLPDEVPGQPPPPALDSSSIVQGEDPTRVELVLNKIGTNISQIDFASVKDTINKDMERMAKAADSVREASNKLGGVAEDGKGAAANAREFFERGTRSFDKLDQIATGSRNSMQHFNGLADDWRSTSHKLNKILDNPALSADLKDTMDKAQQTAQIIQNTMKDLNKTIRDPELRKDLLGGLDQLNKSSENVYGSVKMVRDVTADKELRGELKTMISQAHETVERANEIVNQPGFTADVRSTLAQVKKSAQDLQIVSRQINQILNQKRPLFKMLTGSPGKLKKDGVIVPDVEVTPVPVQEEKSNEKLADPKKETIESK